MKRHYTLLRKSVFHHSAQSRNLDTSSANHLINEQAEFAIEEEEVDAAGAERLSGLGDIETVVPTMPMRLADPAEASPVAGAANGHFENEVAWGVQEVGATRSEYNGRGIVVAVLDSGIQSDHLAFTGVKVSKRDFVGEGQDDELGHGTHCAGTILGRNVNGLRIGIARGVNTVLAGKVLNKTGQGSSVSVTKGLLWAADQGAQVINLSAGIDFSAYLRQMVEQEGMPIEVATSVALEAYQKNINLYTGLIAYLRARHRFAQTSIVLCAAGNENRVFPQKKWRISVGPPGSIDGILSIGAVERYSGKFSRVYFSNMNPNLVGPGAAITSAYSHPIEKTRLHRLNGTSMATAHAAGVAALWAQWLEERGQLTPFNLEAKLAASCSLQNVSADTQSAEIGLGLVQAP